MPKRQSNNPKRRIADAGSFTTEQQNRLLDVAKYVGSAVHKRYPGDYGFHPPINPRPAKSLCDDLRPVLANEAQRLFVAGIRKGVVSTFLIDELPKYVWSVDDQGEVYEAKWDRDGYHGYRLDKGNEKDLRELVLKEWNKR